MAAFGTTVLATEENHKIAQAACTWLWSEKRYTAANPRSRLGGQSYNDICSSLTNMDEDDDYTRAWVIKVGQKYTKNVRLIVVKWKNIYMRFTYLLKFWFRSTRKLNNISLRQYTFFLHCNLDIVKYVVISAAAKMEI